jgi:hypothetical protein
MSETLTHEEIAEASELNHATAPLEMDAERPTDEEIVAQLNGTMDAMDRIHNKTIQEQIKLLNEADDIVLFVVIAQGLEALLENGDVPLYSTDMLLILKSRLLEYIEFEFIKTAVFDEIEKINGGKYNITDKDMKIFDAISKNDHMSSEIKEGTRQYLQDLSNHYKKESN